MSRMRYGGVEAGGTKWVCAIGSGPDDARLADVGPDPGPLGPAV